MQLSQNLNKSLQNNKRKKVISKPIAKIDM